MYQDPTEPSECPPPRQVFEWTRVPGHVTVHPDSRPSFCSCGARQSAGDGRQPHEWREDHLHDAWPILVPRLDNEPYEEWMNRISIEHAEAAQVEQQIAEELGIYKPIPPGGRIPTLTNDYMRANDRVEVLQHQLDEVRRKIVGRPDWRSNL